MPRVDGLTHAARRWGPEAATAVLAAVVFLGFLGAVDLWGKREQRAAAETIDTLRAGHWLVAEIQCRPRLEKPPLPRWTIAGLMALAGRQEEWVVRLPSALSAIGCVGLVYLLGRRLGGRAVGLSAALLLTSLPFFIVEMRQAGNDGPLAFFTALALYAAWRRLHGGGQGEGERKGEILAPAADLGSSRWLLVLYAALGLGFLTKGPIIVLLAGLTLVPYLAIQRRFRPGLKALASGWGALIFLALALSWPVPVVLNDPTAAQVWWLEMGQKTVSAGVAHHNDHPMMVQEWFGMVAPWSILGTWAIVWPLARRGRGFAPQLWFAWSWTTVNLFMFCFWEVAKPNYFVPCLPGAALLIGAEWVRLGRLAAEAGPVASRHARRFVQAHWALFLTLAIVAPVVVARLAPELLNGVIGISLALGAGALGGAWLWRRGEVALAMAPFAASVAVGVMIFYGGLAPGRNALRSHRELAARLQSVLPPETRTVRFFHEIDEGLWFYLDGRELKPVPGSAPEYNTGIDMMREAWKNELVTDPRERLQILLGTLVDWLDLPAGRRDSSYVLLRRDRYDYFAPQLAGRAEVVFREGDLERNELVLIRALDSPAGRPVAVVESGEAVR